MFKIKKGLRVSFNEQVLQFPTYSADEYSRLSINHVLYRRSRNEISDQELQNIYITLDLYKLYDMPVHIDSSKNNLYHTKRVL